MERFTSTVEAVADRFDQQRRIIDDELDRVTAAPRPNRREAYQRLRLMVARYTALRSFLLPAPDTAKPTGTADRAAPGPSGTIAEAAEAFEKTSMTGEDSDQPLDRLIVAVRRELAAETGTAQLGKDPDRLGEIHRALDALADMEVPREQLNPPQDSYAQVWQIARREIDSFLGQVGGAGPGTRES